MIRALRMACIGLALMAHGATVAEEGTADFSGTWILNVEQSDDLDETVREALRAHGRNPAAGEDRVDYLESGAETLEITQTDAEVTVLHADGRLLTFAVGGKKKGDAPAARWEKGRLVLYSNPVGARRSEETLEFVGGEKKLYITTKLIGDRKASVSYLRVYDAAGDEPAEIP
jgi:hypothetical protein